MAFILLVRQCTLVSTDPDLYEIYESLYDTVNQFVGDSVDYQNTCSNFEMSIGQTVHSYCTGSTETEVTYAGAGSVNTNDNLNNPGCCTDLIISTFVEDGTNVGTKKATWIISGSNPAFQIDTGGGFGAISGPGNKHVIDNIGAGTTNYSWQVSDAKSPSCVKNGTLVVNNQGVDCSGISVNVGGVNATFGNSDGQLIATANGGTSPYTYSIDGGPFTGSGTFTGLAAGSYDITARDANGCEYLVDNLIVGETQTAPGSPFDPELIISPIIPYRFVLNKHVDTSFIPDNKLFGNDSRYNTNREGYCHVLNCNGKLTIQIYYVDGAHGTTPRLRIVNNYDDSELTVITFTTLGGGYYAIQRDVSTIVGLCNLNVRFEIWSYYSGTPQYIHSTSENVIVSDHLNTTKLRYWNHSDFKGTKYDGVDYVNEMYIPYIANWQEVAIETKVVEDIGDGHDINLYEEQKRGVYLETRPLPDFMHLKIRLAKAHHNFFMDDIEYVRSSEDEYEHGDYQFKKRIRTGKTLLVVQDKNYENFIDKE